jgi:predicted HicB family RNase H-like nuclease
MEAVEAVEPENPVARFNLRLDRELHRALVLEAARAERSLAREIRWRLRQSLTKRPVMPSASRLST